MNTRRTLSLCAALLITAASSLGAQVRNSVAIVRPRLSEEARKTFLSIARQADRRSPRFTEYFSAMAKGGHGSGYVSLDPSGRTVVITARHVVDFAASADIELQKDDGTVVTVTECPVVYTDDDVDLAVILIPPEKVGSLGADVQPLQLADETPPDGGRVWSAGFPGLLNKPQWQLGNGTVMNRRLQVDEASPGQGVFIQHSAPMDGGLSGGPLLTGDPADPSSFRVVGINTWMMPGRQGSALAIPQEMLREAFARIPSEAQTVDEESAAVEAKARELIDALNAGAWPRGKSGRFISDRMALDGGWDSFIGGMPDAAPDTLKPWSEEIAVRSPVETLRQYLFYRMYRDCSGGDPFTFAGISRTPDGIGSYRVEMARGARSFYVHWIKEAENWHVVMITTTPDGTRPAVAEDLRVPRVFAPISRTPRAFMASIGLVAVPIPGELIGRLGCGVGYSYGLLPWLTVGGTVSLSAAGSPLENPQEALTVVEAAGFVHFNLPIGDSGLFPYLAIAPAAGAAFGGPGASFHAAVGAGGGLVIAFPGSFSIGGEILGRFGADSTFTPRLEAVAMSLYVTFWSP